MKNATALQALALSAAVALAGLSLSACSGAASGGQASSRVLQAESQAVAPHLAALRTYHETPPDDRTDAIKHAAQNAAKELKKLADQGNFKAAILFALTMVDRFYEPDEGQQNDFGSMKRLHAQLEEAGKQGHGDAYVLLIALTLKTEQNPEKLRNYIKKGAGDIKSGAASNWTVFEYPNYALFGFAFLRVIAAIDATIESRDEKILYARQYGKLAIEKGYINQNDLDWMIQAIS